MTRAVLVTTCARPGCTNPVEQGARGRPKLFCRTACRVAVHSAGLRKAGREQRKRQRRRGSVQWYTPPEVFAWFAERWGPFDTDPCSTPRSPVWGLVEHHLVEADDGLVTRWPGRRAFVNPPYGRGHLDAWAERCFRVVEAGEVDVAAMLVPLRPSSGWCRLARERGAILEPYPKRIRFLELTPDGDLVRTSGALFECTALVFRALTESFPSPPPRT